VQQGNIYEIKSTYILQPGPAALTEGVRQLHAILARVCGVPVQSEIQPSESCDPDLHKSSPGRQMSTEELKT
jgi:hypothetical protein